MSGPQGSDPTRAWQPGGQPPDQGETQAAYSPGYGGYQQPQTPGYTPPQQYPGYQPPGGQQFGQQPPGQFGQQPPGQFGQQPPGQFGQQPPGQFGTGAQPAAKKKGGAVIGIVIALVVVVGAVVAVTALWQPGWAVTTELNVNQAQEGVKNVLTDETNGYGAKNVQDVKCNNGANPTVKKGDTFTCDVSIDGQHRQLTVTFQDDKGTYEVGRPKG